MRLVEIYALETIPFVVMALLVLWWDIRKANAVGVRPVKAGTLVHIQGVPFRLHERALFSSSPANWKHVRFK